MAFRKVFVQSSLSLAITYLLACIVHSEASAFLQNRQAESFSCPDNWLHYEKFCVQKGHGQTEKEVATYCDSLGGIGIKGLCIIRAVEDDESPSLWRQQEDLSGTPEYGPEQSRMAPFQDDSLLEEGAECPYGWDHYRSLCVMKPSVKAACAMLGATEIHGLCVKHAGISRIQSMLKRAFGVHNDVKRICCCPPMGHNTNNYAC